MACHPKLWMATETSPPSRLAINPRYEGHPSRGIESEGWLGGRYSNPDNMLQRHASYRWTTSHPVRALSERSKARESKGRNPKYIAPGARAHARDRRARGPRTAPDSRTCP